jgi:hypothetical protein
MPPDEDLLSSPAAHAGVERRVDGGAVLFSDGRGQVRVECPAPAVVVLRVSGVTTEGVIRAGTAVADAVLLRDHAADCFFDLQDAVTQEPGVRSHMQAWDARWGGAIRSIHVLLPSRSKVVAMAVTVASMLLGRRMQTYTQRAAFDAALRAATHG